MEWIFTQRQYYSEATGAAGLKLSCWPVSTVIWARQEEGKHSSLPDRNFGELPRGDVKGFIHPVGALTGLREYTTTADRDGKSALLSHIMFPDAERIYGRNPGEKIKHSNILQ